MAFTLIHLVPHKLTELGLLDARERADPELLTIAPCLETHDPLTRMLMLNCKLIVPFQ